MTQTDTGTYAPRLIVTGGPLDGKPLICGPGVEKVIGTGPGCQLQVEGANVDAAHARVIWEMRGLLLSDLGSGAGTYVNGERVSSEHPLNDGDRVCLGPPGARQSVKLLVVLPPDVAAAAGAAAAESTPAGDVFVLAADESPLVLDNEPPAPPAPMPIAQAAPRPAARPETVPLVVVPAPPEPPELSEPPPEPLELSEPPELPLVAPPAGHAAPQPAGALHEPPPLVLIPPEPSVTAPRPAPPPAPVEREAPAAAVAPRPVAPPRKPTRPDYTSDLPSIAAPDRPLASAAPAARPATRPPAPSRAPGRRRGLSLPRLALPRPVLIGGVTVVLALVALGAYSWLHQAPPVMLAVIPPKVEPGGTVTLTGSGFSAGVAGNVVRFGERPGQVVAASATSLSVTVPSLDVSRGAQNVPVSVETRGVRAGGLFLKVVALPKVTALEPDVALPGAEVSAVGRNLGAKPVRVALGGSAAEVLDAQPERVRFRVPDMPVTPGKTLAVSVSAAGETTQAPALMLGRLPLLLNAEPQSGPPGTRVVLRGRGFGGDAAALQVTFLGRRALVVAAAPAQLTVVAPGLRTGDVQVVAPIVVSLGGASSDPQTYTLTNPASASFVPRFFAADALDAPGQVFVASDLGPLLAFADKGDAPSVAERGARAADALNALVAAWQAGGAAALQVRDAPQPALWAPGAAQPLVSVHAGDVAAYDRRARGASGGARKLAAFWAALIEDYLTLFVQGQRPARVAELSSRGKVLLDLYAEAARRGGAGAGVPRSLVLPLSPALETGLRDLALLPEGAGRAGGARAAAPVEGLWEGSVEEQDGGARRMQLRLRIAGGRLEGEVTTRSGTLGMSTPLGDVSYERGTLKFTLVSGGIPRTFVGTLQGATLSGTIQVPGRKEPIGRFRFDFVQ